MVAKQQDGILFVGLSNDFETFVVDGGREIEAANFGATIQK